MTDFVHLRSHSRYTIDDGLLDTDQLTKLAAENEQFAIAITDSHKLMDAVNFYESARKSGIKPIIGADVWIEPDVTQNTESNMTPTKIVILSKNEAGYKTLMKLISRSYLENQIKGTPYIKQSWFKETDNSNIIVLSGDGYYGEIAQQVKRTDISESEANQNALKSVQFYKSVLKDNFYLEVQRADFEKEYEINKLTISLHNHTNTEIVATHPIQFEKRSDYYIHEIRTCIASDEKVDDITRKSKFTREQYFKSTEEMEYLFQDMPNALENAAIIAKKCNVKIELYKEKLPEFPTRDGLSVPEMLREDSIFGLEQRLKLDFPDEQKRNEVRELYEARLNTELDIIINMKYPGYFMIVADFIQWAKNNFGDNCIGPGRGSGAGSLVAYALKITNIDPIKYTLLFERFLNPERVSMPDFDIDMAPDIREDIINYVREKYDGKDGRLAVSQISTLGMMKAKAVTRDVGRTLNYNNLMVDSIAKLIPGGPKNQDITLKQALEQSPRLKEKYDSAKDVSRLIDLAIQLEGLPKSIGKHAAGVVISPTEVADFSPVYLAEGGTVVSQYDKNQVEHAGLVKFDFLGLQNLTIIDNAIKAIKEELNEDIDLQTIPLDDKEVYKNMSMGNSVGVFQFESKGMQQLLIQAKPSTLEDLIAIVALYRPGPINSGMLQNYIDRKNGTEEVSYPDPKWQHEKLKPILEPTYGIIVYQEQVMQIAQALAGYSLGGADMLRRAMGKKKPEEMAAQRSVFEEGAKKEGVDPELAIKIFDLVEKFAGYGFNKSHSAAYALISYQTAYLKTHYAAQYYSAYMNIAGVDKGNTKKLEILVQDARKNNIELMPPDINEGSVDFKAIGKNKIRYGLASLKDVTAAALEALKQTKEEEGPFTSFFDFCKRTGRSKINNKTVERLIQAGSFDSLHKNRATLYASVKDGLKYSSQLAKEEAEKGSIIPELFGDNGLAEIADPVKKKRKTKKVKEPVVEPMLTQMDPWNAAETLEKEKSAVGFYFSAHPFDLYKQKLGGLKAALPLDLIDLQEPSRTETYLIAGLVEDRYDHTTARGTKMAFLKINDGISSRDVTLFSDAFEGKEDMLENDKFIAIEAEIQKPYREGETSNSVLGRTIFSFQDIQYRLAVGVSLAIETEKVEELLPVLEKHKGVLRVVLYHPKKNSTDYSVAPLNPETYGVTGTPECWEDLQKVVGDERRMSISYEKSIVFEQKMQKKPKM